MTHRSNLFTDSNVGKEMRRGKFGWFIRKREDGIAHHFREGIVFKLLILGGLLVYMVLNVKMLDRICQRARNEELNVKIHKGSSRK